MHPHGTGRHPRHPRQRHVWCCRVPVAVPLELTSWRLALGLGLRRAQDGRAQRKLYLRRRRGRGGPLDHAESVNAAVLGYVLRRRRLPLELGQLGSRLGALAIGERRPRERRAFEHRVWRAAGEQRARSQGELVRDVARRLGEPQPVRRGRRRLREGGVHREHRRLQAVRPVLLVPCARRRAAPRRGRATCLGSASAVRVRVRVFGFGFGFG